MTLYQTKEEVFILAAKRTATGSYGGVFSSLTAVDLGVSVVKNLIEASQIDAEKIASIVMGNVVSANLGQNPARQVAILAGLPTQVCATNINKVCASGMKAISILANDLRLDNCQIGVAGGMESMSQTPHYLPKARFGTGYGNVTMIDGLAKDGLTDVYSQASMGVCGDKTAERYHISREEQDDFSEKSFRKAIQAQENNVFENEIVPITISSKKGSVSYATDEQIARANFEKMRSLRPAFSPNGTVTAANASPMNDGASALLLANSTFVENEKVKPLAKIIAYAEAEHEPTFFTTAPVSATQKVLQKANLSVADIDFFEVNEAFSVVPMVFMQELSIDAEKVNKYGGAVALGHALGSSGSRIVVTLLNVLKANKARYGLAAICNGGGGASAIIIENLYDE